MSYHHTDKLAKSDRAAYANAYMPDSEGYPGFINNYPMMPVQPKQYDLYNDSAPTHPTRTPEDDLNIDQKTNYHVEFEDKKTKGKQEKAKVGVASLFLGVAVALAVGVSVTNQ